MGVVVALTLGIRAATHDGVDSPINGVASYTDIEWLTCQAGNVTGMWTWCKQAARAAVFLLRGIGTSLLGVLLVFAFALSMVASLVAIGIPWLVESTRGLRALARRERRHCGKFLGVEISSAYRPLQGNSLRQLRIIAGEGATYRDFLWLIEHIVVSSALGFAAIACWFNLILGASLPLWWWSVGRGDITYYVITLDSWPDAWLAFGLAVGLFGSIAILVLPLLAKGQAWVAKALLAPTRQAELAHRVQELATTRAEALDAHAVELRRIERDLHDTTQARLVAIAMRLGIAEQQLSGDPEQAKQLLTQAREGAEEAIVELRDVVRGIYPPILADRGLSGAVSALAAASPLPVQVYTSQLGVVPAAVESAAYFIITEALTNVAKHARANRVTVELWRENNRMFVHITDDGRGGADPSAGTGLRGMQRRVAAHDGVFTLTSPTGGPTVVRAELLCG